MPENNPTPEMFGAIGDGVHNDAPAINACLVKYGKVYFDAKTYVIGQSEPVPDSDLYRCNTIEFKTNDVLFFGKGIGKTILKFADNNQLISKSPINSTRMLSSKWNTNCNNATIKGITFDGNYDNNKHEGTIHAIRIMGLNTNISECEFINFGIGDNGVDECFQIFLTIADSTTEQGTFIIRDNVFRSPGKKTGTQSNQNVPENTFIGISGNDSLFITGVQVIGNKFVDCSFDVVSQQSPIHGITLAYTNEALISNNTFTNFDGICYYVNSWKNTGTTITNNVAINVGMFVCLACESMPNSNQISYNEDYTIENNKIELMTKPYFWKFDKAPLAPIAIFYHFDSSLDKKTNYPFRHILIKNNTIKLNNMGKLFYGMGQNINEEFIFENNVVDSPSTKTKKIVMLSLVGVIGLIVVLIFVLK